MVAWVEQSQAVMVAVDAAGAVVGTYYLRPNTLELGVHVANAGYAVAEHCIAGRGSAATSASAPCRRPGAWASGRCSSTRW